MVWLQRQNRYDAWAGKSVDRMIREARRRRRPSHRRRDVAVAAILGLSFTMVALGHQGAPYPTLNPAGLGGPAGAQASALVAGNPGLSSSPSATPGLTTSPGPSLGPSPSQIIAGATATPLPASQPPLDQSTVTIVAAGDIACDPNSNIGQPAQCDQAGTAALIGQLQPTAVVTLGDNQYLGGTLASYQAVYGSTWGAYRAITFPTIGEHEYLTNGAAGYFSYFNVPAYYSFNLGAWHIIVLDSECHYIGGCAAGSEQERWLQEDLGTHPNRCTLVTWHEPRWSSGEYGDGAQMATIWADIVAAHVDVVLSAHTHDYERFEPLDGAGVPDPNGTAEFVVGTGGKDHYDFTSPALSGEVARDDTSFGVIHMTLTPTGYSWQFVPAATYSFKDSGSASCH